MNDYKPFHDKYGRAIQPGDIVYSDQCQAHFKVIELVNGDDNIRQPFIRADRLRRDPFNPLHTTLSMWHGMTITQSSNLDEAPDHKPMQPAPEPYDPPTRRARKPKPEAPKLYVHARYAEFRTLVTRVFAEMAPKATLIVTDLVQKEPAMFMLEYDVGTGRNQCCWEARTSMSSLEHFVRGMLQHSAVTLLAKK